MNKEAAIHRYKTGFTPSPTGTSTKRQARAQDYDDDVEYVPNDRSDQKYSSDAGESLIGIYDRFDNWYQNLDDGNQKLFLVPSLLVRLLVNTISAIDQNVVYWLRKPFSQIFGERSLMGPLCLALLLSSFYLLPFFQSSDDLNSPVNYTVPTSGDHAEYSHLVAKQMRDLEQRMLKRVDEMSKKVDHSVHQAVKDSSEETKKSLASFREVLNEHTNKVLRQALADRDEKQPSTQPGSHPETPIQTIVDQVIASLLADKTITREVDSSLRKGFDKFETELSNKYDHSAVATAVSQHPSLIQKIEDKVKAAYDKFLTKLEDRFSSENIVESERGKIEKMINTVVDKAIKILPHPPARDSASGSGATFDPSQVEHIVDRKLETYHADQLGKIDWALSSLGAYIVPSRTSPPHVKPSSSLATRTWIENVFARQSKPHSFAPETILQPVGPAGTCWAFVGSSGKVAVHLAYAVNITAVTIDHIDFRTAPNPESTLRDFRVLGLSNEASAGTELGEFRFETSGHPIQTFQLARPGVYPIVLLEVLSNHGFEYTCIYRLRVHGERFVSV